MGGRVLWKEYHIDIGTLCYIYVSRQLFVYTTYTFSVEMCREDIVWTYILNIWSWSPLSMVVRYYRTNK